MQKPFSLYLVLIQKTECILRSQHSVANVLSGCRVDTLPLLHHVWYYKRGKTQFTARSHLTCFESPQSHYMFYHKMYFNSIFFFFKNNHERNARLLPLSSVCLLLCEFPLLCAVLITGIRMVTFNPRILILAVTVNDIRSEILH